MAYAHIVIYTIPDLTQAPHFVPVGDEFGSLRFAFDFELHYVFIFDWSPPRNTFLWKSSIEKGPHRVGSVASLMKWADALDVAYRDEGKAVFDRPGFPARLSENQVVDPDELTEIRNTVLWYNYIIREEVDTRNRERTAKPPPLNPILVVDTYQIFSDASRSLTSAGRPVRISTGLVHLNTEARGGIFSLDGIHPGQAGHAIVADETIARIIKAFREGEILNPDSATFGGVGWAQWRRFTPLENEEILKKDPLTRKLCK